MPMTAEALSWERFSGLPTQREQHRGVAAVQVCTGAGHIAVGAQTPTAGAPPNTNFLIERLDPNGNFGWRYTYDSGRPEQLAEVVEYTDGTGFAVVGTIDPTGSPAVSALTLSKIDCNGNMLWHRTLGPTTGVNVAWDLIRANTGNGVTTFAGDLIVVGEFTPSTGGPTVVRVARLRNTGALIWMNHYVAAGGLSLKGRGIAEVDTPSITDDLVVGGGVGNNGSIFQINGDTGAFICGSQLPGLGISQFNDITRHGNAVIAPGFTVVGETRNATSTGQIFVASYRSTTCALQRQVHWGATTADESAQAVTTVRATTFTGVPDGQLLIVGNMKGPFSTNPGSTDAWSHLMVPINLTPFTTGGYTGQRYGTQGAGLAGIETAAGVIETGTDAYFVGASTSAWAGADPQHAYTARISFNNMKTLCSVPWTAPATFLTPNTALTVTPTAVGPVSQLNPLTRTPLTTHGYCCAIGP
ncbi:MAG: hypothetical protein E6Q88_06785 [Lysobacteraceae bacterium]|nr:MAG: hypothetical protein E6Q88_06785 [Xanthomonadaceae bacterium]